MSANGMTEHARNNQRLIIGPWTHGYHFSGVVGEVDFGPEASGDYIQDLRRLVRPLAQG